uniref:Uncharacterized protein n=1 Tax=Pseudomonas aeruginosa TaxID=287 RepID=P96962_PSEAI|nr:unknown [Pseudomonas aeruginosa]
MHAQGGGRRQEQQLELQGTGHRRGAEPVVERQPQAGQPQAADHLQQQGGDADPLVDLLEGADRLGIAAAHGAGEDAEGHDQWPPTQIAAPTRCRNSSVRMEVSLSGHQCRAKRGRSRLIGI